MFEFKYWVLCPYTGDRLAASSKFGAISLINRLNANDPTGFNGMHYDLDVSQGDPDSLHSKCLEKTMEMYGNNSSG